MVALFPGTVFDPSDREIVRHYLPKLIDSNDAGLGNLSYVFKVCDVYSTKPWLLFVNDELLPYMKGNQRFVYTSRQKISQKNANGKRPRRILHGVSEADGGYWKSSTGEKPIFEDGGKEGKVIGYVNMLNFYEYNTEKKNRKYDIKSSWIMYEYRLAGDSFQERVICKIKNTSFSEADAYEDIWLPQLFCKDDEKVESSNNMVEWRLQSADDQLQEGSSCATFLEPVVDGESCIAAGCGGGGGIVNKEVEEWLDQILVDDDDDPFSEIGQLLNEF
ncbi:hypothetical protein PTKIN_Ptkin16aG0082400 [Pterospermum kingtungense]